MWKILKTIAQGRAVSPNEWTEVRGFLALGETAPPNTIGKRVFDFIPVSKPTRRWASYL